MDIPETPADWQELRMTIQAAGPIEVLAERLAERVGATSVHHLTAYWNTELEELGVTSQEVGRVEMICDPERVLYALAIVAEWGSTVGVSTVQVELQPTYPFLYLRGD